MLAYLPQRLGWYNWYIHALAIEITSAACVTIDSAITKDITVQCILILIFLLDNGKPLKFIQRH